MIVINFFIPPLSFMLQLAAAVPRLFMLPTMILVRRLVGIILIIARVPTYPEKF